MASPAAGFRSGSAAAAVPFCSAFGGSIEPMGLAESAPTRSGLDGEGNGINNSGTDFTLELLGSLCKLRIGPNNFNIFTYPRNSEFYFK